MQNLILSDFQVQQIICHHSKSKAFLTFVTNTFSGVDVTIDSFLMNGIIYRIHDEILHRLNQYHRRYLYQLHLPQSLF